MGTVSIPFVLMRGGTSRGPYFRRDDLPADRDELAEALIGAVGAGHPLNIDGIGGGVAVTTKVAILSRSDDPSAEIDYLFAQVGVTSRTVDFSPSCGNILAGVGPAAVELGLLTPAGDVTTAMIRNVNTGALIEARFETPNGQPNYEGAARIDGVDGTAAPVVLNFMDVVGSKTGALFPTGQAVDRFGRLEATLIDVAMPMMIFRAGDVGLDGYETAEELAAAGLFERLEPLRIEAGLRMGLAATAEEVSRSVVPKVGFLASPRATGHVYSRYMMPQGDRWDPHPSHAVTGAVCVAACVLAPGTIAAGLASTPGEGAPLQIEHPSGVIDCAVRHRVEDGTLLLESAGILRTARKIASGLIHVPLDPSMRLAS